MAWELKDVLATIDKAMQLEAEGRQFYLAAAERTSDPAGKKMFASLAADEEEHYDKLKREHDQLAAAGKWLRSVDVVVRQPARWKPPAIFPTQSQRARGEVKPDANDVDALKMALKAEKDSYDFYSASRDKAEGEDAKALFSFLAEEEMGHYRLLDSALAYLGDTASFFLIEERAINEG